ncbi:MAG: response regulator [Flavobacterium sp.]|jgi:DNA-binding NarL/FixJ family response regulator|uniref:response regulator n=1 Tax=Flavobacterium sp. TaxID=239 RepID=UPI003BA6AB84
MAKTTLCIIDDHAIVRHGLKELLQKMNTYEVIHEFDNGEDFLQALPLQPPPDMYILDYSMPNMNGIEVLKALEEKDTEYKVLLLTQHFEEDIINLAFHHGARGFLHKNCSAAELKYAIDNIITIGFNNITDILKRIRNFDPSPKNQKAEIILTPRELHFLQLVCNEEEYTYEQMANIMNVSVKSIEAYRTALFEKYSIKSKVGLVLFSYKYKLTEPFLE